MASSSDMTPFVNPVLTIKGGLQYGHLITIKGNALVLNGTRFAVNFHIDSSDKDIAFHFNPRFEEGGYVVCNTKQKEWWEQEERTMRNPIEQGKPFEISILVESAYFQVKVNGNFFTSYTHRVPFHRVDKISVTGPVGLSCFNIHDTRAVSGQK